MRIVPSTLSRRERIKVPEQMFKENNVLVKSDTGERVKTVDLEEDLYLATDNAAKLNRVNMEVKRKQKSLC